MNHHFEKCPDHGIVYNPATLGECPECHFKKTNPHSEFKVKPVARNQSQKYKQRMA